MKHVLLVLGFLLLLSTSLAAQTRVACMFSKAMNYIYKPDQTQILASLGWSEDLYENTQIKDMVNRLSHYDIVVMNALFNYETTQDLSKYGKDFREYLEKGGCLIVTDANYPSQTEWLSSIDQNLIWKPTMIVNESPGKLPWANNTHPLTANEENPGTAWTYPGAVTAYMTPLYKNANGSPAGVVMEIGQGAVIVSSLYNQTGWPTKAFFSKLQNWLKDPERLTDAKKRTEEARSRLESLPKLDVPELNGKFKMDGVVDADEWSGAAVIESFYDTFGRSDVLQPTKCRIARTEHYIYIAFECVDDNAADIVKGVTERDGRTWDNDSVEVFLNPGGDRKDYYQFAVGCSGAQYDGKGWDATWDTYWEAKTSISDKGWSAEIKIPIAFINHDEMNPDGIWTANFNRFARPNAGREFSGWSTTFSGFHQVERFGTISGMKIKAASNVFDPRIRIDSPKEWYQGSNNIDITLHKNRKKSENAVLNLVDTATGDIIWSKDIASTGKTSIRTKYDLILSSDTSATMQFILAAANDRTRVLASSNLLKAKPAPQLSLSMVMPIVKNSIQSKDPVKKMIVEGVAAYGISDDLVLECVGVNTYGKTISKAQHKIRSRKYFKISTDVVKLPVGKYSFTYALLRNGQQVASETIPLTIAPPAATEVTFDDKHNCYVNGKPFFPIGLYHVSPAAFGLLNEKSRTRGLPELDMFETIKQLKDMGFNTVHHTWGMPDEKYLQYTQSLGMWVVPEVAAPTREQVALANKYSNVLMWYGSDEPSGEMLNVIKRARIQTADYDPNRPVSAAVCNPELFKDALGGFDFVMMDPYLIRHAPLSGIADWIAKGFDAGKGQKPVWLVPQAFTIDSPSWKEPTPEELKCQAYIGLVHGVKGFIWYAFWTSENWSESPVNRGCWVLSDTKLWDAFPKLNSQVNELAPMIMFGKNKGPVKCSSKGVHTCLWTYKGKSYLIAVNTLYEPVKCTLKGINGKAEVMFENRTVTVDGGVLSESFKPLEVHVYRF